VYSKLRRAGAVKAPALFHDIAQRRARQEQTDEQNGRMKKADAILPDTSDIPKTHRK
jgi:hypothetical protein